MVDTGAERCPQANSAELDQHQLAEVVASAAPRHHHLAELVVIMGDDAATSARWWGDAAIWATSSPVSRFGVP
ncbi:hypothetical protein AB0K27_13200 [Micromonospora echinospora]|uniref:hypothetical protein n=1 Tax=Micromonospora echinospora TaxID=1877 RepID=UPI0034124D0A